MVREKRYKLLNDFLGWLEENDYHIVSEEDLYDNLGTWAEPGYTEQLVADYLRGRDVPTI